MAKSGAVEHVMPAWLYYLRFMWAGVRMLWPGGEWTLRQAIAAIHNEHACVVESDWQQSHDPDADVRECLSYWDDDGDDR